MEIKIVDQSTRVNVNEAQITKWFGIYIKGNVPAFTFEPPCGHRVEYRDFADVPREDVPCPCGDPNHWVVKYDR